MKLTQSSSRLFTRLSVPSLLFIFLEELSSNFLLFVVISLQLTILDNDNVYLGCEHVGEASCGTLQCDASEEEDGEHQIGKQSSEVDNLARTCNACTNKC